MAHFSTVENTQFGAQEFGKVIRPHGSIGNLLHWYLGVVFLEDMRKDHGPDNMATARKMAL